MTDRPRNRPRPTAALAVGFLLTLATARISSAQDTPPPQSPPPPPPQPTFVPPPGYMPPAGTPSPFFVPPPPLTPEPPKTHSDPDRGLVVGGAIGIGTFSYYGCGDVCGDAGMGELHLGGMLAQGLALEIDLWGGFHPFSDRRFGSGASLIDISTLAVQYWGSDGFWAKAGIGVGNIRSTNAGAGTALTEQTTVAFLAAIGYELARTYHCTYDLQLRYGSASFSGVDDNPNPVTALFGLTWR